MKSIIFYSSDYRTNTEKIAEVMASEIESDYVNIRTLKTEEIDAEQFDLIGFGSGVYREDLSPQLYRFADRLDLKDKKVFVFSTSGIGMNFYNKRLLRRLTSKGALSIGSFACKGSFTTSDFSKIKIFNWLEKFAEGHPNANDFSDVRKFILKITDSMNNR